MRRTMTVAVLGALLAALLATPAAASTSGEDAVPIPVGDDANAALVEEPDAGTERTARLARELAMARGELGASDMVGIEASLYQGKWFVPKADDNRRCIIDRESNGRYDAVSAGGLYRGAYQMSRALAEGATWMMQKEVKRELGDEGVALVQALRDTPTHKWNRYWQDRAFWTIWRKGEGKRHWFHGALKC